MRNNFFNSLLGVLRYLQRWIAIAIILIIILFASVISILKTITPYLDRYHIQIQQWASRIIKQPISIEHISANWHGLEPVINLQNVIIYDKYKGYPILQVKHFQIGINIIDSLLHLKIMPGEIQIDGATLVIFQKLKQKVEVSHFSWNTNKIVSLKKSNFKSLINWLLVYRKISFKNVTIYWHVVNNKIIIFSQLRAKLINGFYTHHFVVDTVLKQKIPTTLHLSIKMEGNWFIDTHARIIAKINAKRVVLMQWLANYLWHGNLFRQPLYLGDVNGHISWLKQRSNWQFKLTDIFIHNPHFEVNGGVSLRKNDGQSKPIIDLLVGFKTNGVQWISKYLPYGILHRRLANWLHYALVNGKGFSGMVLVRGPLQYFPFKQSRGKFSAQIQLHDIDLRYAKNWPLITQINGHLTFNNQQLTVHFASGRIGKISSLKAKAMIPDITHSILTLTGKLSADLAKYVDLIKTTPLEGKFGSIFKNMRLSGPAHLSLEIIKPLCSHNSNLVKVSGNIVAQNAQIFFPALNAQIDNIIGKLRFTNNRVNANNLRGTLFNEPINASISTMYPTKKSSIIAITLGGHLSIDALKKHYNWKILHYLDGGSDYKALFQFYNDAKKYLHWRLISDLQGISVNVPKPFSKKTNQRLSFNFTANYRKNFPIDVKLRYGNLLEAIFRFISHKNGWLLSGANVHIGQKSSSFISDAGLIIDGKMKQLDWELWYPFVQSYLKLNNKQLKNNHFSLKKISLFLDKLKFHGITLKQVKLAVTPKKYGWEFGINNNKVDGIVMLPNDYEKAGITGSFKRLYLSDQQYEDKKYNIEADKIPSLNILIKDFRFGKRIFGKTQLTTEKEKKYMYIKTFRVDSPIVHLLVSGEWRTLLPDQLTSIAGMLNSQNLGQILKNWNVASNLYYGKGTMKFHFRWIGTPFKFDLATLNGEIGFDFYNGRITGLNEKTNEDLGFGSFLTLLSLQSLSQRVETGFTDLTKKGFTFTVLKGDFILQDGNALTRDTYLDGPTAKAETWGRIGLAKKDYDLEIRIIPYVTSSVPLIATIAGGPIVGAIAWVTNKILSPEVDRISRKTIRVTGTWKKPKLLKLPEPKQELK